jgi:hypothetical protein
MPLLFSYGMLQYEDVQIATFGRKLGGEQDALAGFELSRVKIEDPEIAARLGRTHHADVVRVRDDAARVPGVVFEVTDAELARADRFEAEFAYERVLAPLASGRETWVYVHRESR